MKTYKVLLNKKTCDKAMSYLEYLKSGMSSGKFLQKRLHGKNISRLSLNEFIELLMRTKRPQIFAESSVAGDGSDWSQEELSILGDIGVATPVKVYDNGKHYKPDVYEHPLNATLLFTPGSLLRNGRHNIPADWNEVTRNDKINSEAYYDLYERRLFPLFMYANQIAKENDRKAFITIPGIGCGQFAGKFIKQLGSELKNALIKFLNNHGHNFSNINAVYYDPYSECDNERYEINNIYFLVRPLTKGNEHKPQLCHPKTYEEKGDNFTDCELFSFVAWDHVSWPGNDFYEGSRTTDDGVKAAATNSMEVMTGVEGIYDAKRYQYHPPGEYSNWRDVIVKNNIVLEVKQNIIIYP